MGSNGADHIRPGLDIPDRGRHDRCLLMKGEPPLNEDFPPQFPQVGDEIDVQGDAILHLAPGLHKLIIVGIRDGYSLFDCATPDGELELQIFPSEIIDWRKTP